VNKTIGPDKVLRGIAFACLLGMGASAIYVVKHPGDLSLLMAQLRSTGGYLTFELLLFGLFYGQYVWVPRFLKRPLHVGFGFVQTFLCLALLLFGLFPIWMPDLGAPAMFNVDNMAVTIAILGEALFAVNVCWTLLRPAPAVLVPVEAQKPVGPPPLQAELHPSAPLQAGKKPKFDYSRWLKPENPVEKFGVTAIFLFAGGALLWPVLPESQFLILWAGQKHFLAMGMLWWICAIPFALFSLAYWLHAGKRSVPYDKWMTKVHLGLTFVWLVDFVRIVMMAQWSMLSRLPDLLMDNYTFELYVLLGAAVAMFFVNIRTKIRVATK
jgi:hypothetical protein